MKAEKVELLMPAGSIECLRAVVANGADAVYLGLSRFNARMFAGNFTERNIKSVIDFCHNHKPNPVKVYVAMNILVKNKELAKYFELMDIIAQAGADAVIIQEHSFIRIIRENFPNLKIHLSTQATTTNSYSIPSGEFAVDRVILARELSIDEIREITKKASPIGTEIFVHGALCFSYSGQCLFSSVVGGRSGNRGMCAQPCRKVYNNRYLLSTMDLCLLPKLPEMISLGVKALKVEGRMRSELYVATVARIYRKYIDLYYQGKFTDEKQIEEKDMNDLKVAFSREFTTGFAFNSSITDSRMQTNRGLYLGNFRDNTIKLKHELKIGDGIGIWKKTGTHGYYVESMLKEGKEVQEAHKGDIIELPQPEDGAAVYKTSSVDLKADLGEEFFPRETDLWSRELKLPETRLIDNEDSIKIAVKAYKFESAIAADKAKADIIYYDILSRDCLQAKEQLKHAKFFVYTPRIASDKEIDEIIKKIDELKPKGVLIGNKGFTRFLINKGYELHADYSFNCFNDIDLNHYRTHGLTPIISPELNFDELKAMKDKNFIALTHGDIMLMTTKEKLKAPELVDETGAHFRVRENNGLFEILNSKQLGLFNKSLDYLKAGIRYFYIDMQKEPEKFAKIYRKILSGEKFDDAKIRKGCTTGHFLRGVA